jgi:hypothetical protein
MYYAPGGQFDRTLFGEPSYNARRLGVRRAYLEGMPANVRSFATTLPRRPAIRTPSVAATPIVSASVAADAPVDTQARAGPATLAENVHPAATATPANTSVPDRVDKVSTPVRATFPQLNVSGGPGSSTRASSMSPDRGSETPPVSHLDNTRKAVEKKRKKIERMKLQVKILQDEEELEVLQEASVLSPSGTFGAR